MHRLSFKLYSISLFHWNSTQIEITQDTSAKIDQLPKTMEIYNKQHEYIKQHTKTRQEQIKTIN